MITVSTRGIYGLIALVEIGRFYKKKHLQIKDISKDKDIPKHYLEQILLNLKRQGIVKSFRGIRGGYTLARDPKKISLNEILDCLETELQLNRANITSDYFKKFWDTRTKEVKEVFEMSLDDIIKDHNTYTDSLTYHI